MFIKDFIDKGSIKVYKLHKYVAPNKKSFHKSAAQSRTNVSSALTEAPTPLLAICSSLIL